MQLQLTKATNRPIVEFFGGPSGPFAGNVTKLTAFIGNKSGDAWISPHDLFDVWNDYSYIKYLRELAEAKPIFVFNLGDFAKHLCHPNIISLQTSVETGYSCTKHQTIVIPYNVEVKSKFFPRTYSSEPLVSFMGYVPKISPHRIAKSLWPLPPKVFKRNSALIRNFGIHNIKSLSNSNVTIRRQYSGTFKVHKAEPLLRTFYEESIMNSDFVFCPRGDGNQSQRFYETLSVGRVPIVPDSDIKFPKVPNYEISQHFLTVRALSFDLRENVMTFWKDLEPDTYIQHQLKLLHFYHNYFSQNVYIKTLFSSNFKDLHNYCI